MPLRLSNCKNVPHEGDEVIFSKVPNGSWLSTDVPYIAERVTDECVYFRNAVTGSGTYDALYFVEHTSIWTRLEQTAFTS